MIQFLNIPVILVSFDEKVELWKRVLFVFEIRTVNIIVNVIEGVCCYLFSCYGNKFRSRFLHWLIVLSSG